MFLNIQKWSATHLAIDLRALAVVRVACGCFLCLICLGILGNVDHLLADTGIFPRDARFLELNHENGSDALWSLAFLSGSTIWNSFLLFLGCVSGLALALGWNSKLTTILCWIIFASIRSRNPYAGDGGDSLMKVILFWAMFLPWGNRWSFDALRRHRKNPCGIETSYLQLENTFFSGATAAILLQICIVYWIAAVAKFDSSWRIEGTAMAEAMGIQILTRPIADFLLGFPLMLKITTHMVLVVEEAGPVAAIVASLNSRWRLLGPLSMILLHLGIALTFTLGVFPWISISAWLLFLPTCLWDGFEQLLRTGSLKKSNPSTMKVSTTAPDTDSPLIQVIRPEGRLAKITQNFIPIFLMVMVIWWNLASLPLARSGIKMPLLLRQTMFALHLNQGWGFFAPAVNTREGRYVIHAKLQNGQQADLTWNGTRQDSDRPPSLRNLYPHKRWRQHLQYVFHSRKVAPIESYVHWLQRQWDGAHPENPILDLSVYFMLQDNRYPEDGISRVKVYPIERISESGRAIFPGDTRRNQEREEQANVHKKFLESQQGKPES